MNGRNSSFCLVGKEGPSSEKHGVCQKQQCLFLSPHARFSLKLQN